MDLLNFEQSSILMTPSLLAMVCALTSSLTERREPGVDLRLQPQINMRVRFEIRPFKFVEARPSFGGAMLKRPQGV